MFREGDRIVLAVLYDHRRCSKTCNLNKPIVCKVEKLAFMINVYQTDEIICHEDLCGEYCIPIDKDYMINYRRFYV